jgi:hypothetical protein
MENTEMKKRVEYKDVEINGRKFRIGRFDAIEGSYMLFKIVGVISPLISKMSSPSSDGEVNYSDVLSGITTLSKKDFKEIQLSCLGICSEHLPAGFAKVINENGSYGVMGIEKDTATVLNLTVQALMFNVSDFFAGSPSNFLAGVTSNIF